MLYTIPLMSFQEGHSRPRRQCTLFDPPACRSPHAERTHHLFRRGPCRNEPSGLDIASLLGALVNVFGNDGETGQQPEWTKLVRCEGFTSEEITVSISEEKVLVQGSRTSTDGEGSTEVRQIKKTIVIPSDVSPESVKAFYNQDGTLFLQGDRKATEKKVSLEKAMDKDRADSEETSDQGETTESSESQTAHTEDHADGTTNYKDTLTEDNETCVLEFVGTPVYNELKVDQSAKENNETLDKERKNGLTDVAGSETESREQTTTETEELAKETQEKPVSMIEPTEAKDSEKEFKLEVDVRKFKPESIQVKSTSNSVTIVGQQDEVDRKTGKVTDTKTLWRKFFLPVSVNSDLLTSELTDGKLTITGPFIS